MPESRAESGRTVVIGERELAIGFRLIGLSDVVEVSTENQVAEFQRVAAMTDVSLIIATQAIRAALPENTRALADSSLRPLVVFIPTPKGEYEVESINTLAKRVLGVSLVPAG